MNLSYWFRHTHSFISYWLRRLSWLVAWPYGSPTVSDHQRRREIFLTRMWEQPTDVGLNLCSLAVQYLNALEATEEELTKRCWDYQEQRTLEVFCNDLRQRVTQLDAATDPRITGSVITAKTLDRWQWDDNLRFAMGLPNEQYGPVLETINPLIAELSTYPA